MEAHPSRSPRTIRQVSPTTLLLVGIVALLVLLPTRRLQLAGWSRQNLTLYFLGMWALGALVAALPAPARFLIPILLVAYLAPFVTLREGLDRLMGRPPRSRGDIPGSGGPGGGGDAPPPIKNVTPPDERARANAGERNR